VIVIKLPPRHRIPSVRDFLPIPEFTTLKKNDCVLAAESFHTPDVVNVALIRGGEVGRRAAFGIDTFTGTKASFLGYP
jgi:hypothetical protein